MINAILHWNKKKWIFIALAFILLLTAVLIYNSYITKKRYKEQTTMAQEYFEEGNYEEAVKAYQKALSMNYGDRELLSIGLAESYAGINNYDRALEVLRSRYEIEKTNAVKEKIEEISAKKADHSFYQLISFGDTYFSNEEYNKAIDEYEKAKLIMSKEDISYLKIVESYIAMEEYNLAKEEIQEGLELTESTKLKEMLIKVETRLNEIKYDEILLKASEYIYQENYEEAFNSFNEAIWLIPEKDLAYNQMAELYISMGEYDTAKALIQNFLRSNVSEASQEILNKANELIRQRKEKQRILNELYTALSVVDIEEITKIMKDSFFIEVIAIEAPFYYSPSGNLNTAMGYGMFIADKNNIYAGGFRDKMKEGIGIQFVLHENEKNSGWYYYQGEWNHDMPNGMGKTGEGVLEKDSVGKWQNKVTETSGLFVYGLESGGMQKTFYINEEEIGRVYYTASDGVPKPYLDENGQEIQADKPYQYVIGPIYLNNEPTGEYYSVNNNTKFTVKLNND